jgi:O-succinylbenzoate synthase
MAIHNPLLHRLGTLNQVCWRIYSYQLPYVSGGIREGLLIHTRDSQRNERWGEVAPLAGRSAETLEAALKQLLDYFSGKEIKQLFPSVQCGLENLFLPAFSQVNAQLYALLSGSPQEVLRQADTAAELGYSTVKVKISSFPLNTSREIINALQKRFFLRVDCNSAFSFEEAHSLFSPFAPNTFDYIEDPTYEMNRLPEFPHPFALDETVSQYRRLPLESYLKLYGFVLKPSILGGKKGCTPYVDFAKKHHLKVVFSPAFESGVGLVQILSLAKHFDLLAHPLGLDTYRFLKHDLLMPAINFSTPNLTVLAPPQINLKLLTEIAHGTSALPPL